MIEINLLPEELRKKELPKLAMPDIPVGGVKAGVVIFLGIHGIVLLTTLIMNYQLGAMRTEATDLGQMNREITRQKTQTVAMQSRLKQIDGLVQRKFYWTSLLNALSDSTIKGVWLNRLYISEKKEKSIAKSQKKPAKAQNAAAPGTSEANWKDRAVSSASSAGSKVKAGSFKLLCIEGSVVGQGRETETIGRFIQELETNKLCAELFSDVELVNILHKKIKDYDVYEFLIDCWFNPEKAPTGSSYGG